MQFKIKNNIKDVTKGLNKMQKKQIPFATVVSINQTLFGLRKEMAKQTIKKLDRPTKATQSGFIFTKAKKANLIGTLFLKSFVEDYLRFQIDGGVRSSSKFFVAPTRNSKLNKFGNIVGKKSGLIKKSTQFFSTINGVAGIYERTNKGNKIKLIHALIKSATYKAKFPFYKIADGFAKSHFQKNFVKALQKALRTAK